VSRVGRAPGDPTGPAFETVEQWLRDVGPRLEPDPLFRQRLRSDVMNAWVAAREGLGEPLYGGALEKRMGTLGRACLYASVALCASVAGVMAASSQSLPGEPLYAIKLRVEELRLEALPTQFHDELAINALAERIHEMDRLAAAGMGADAIAMLPAIERQYADLLRLLEGVGSTARADFLGHRLGVVVGLVESLPAELRDIVVGLMPGLPVTRPVVDLDEPDPSPTGEQAEPAESPPAVDPPPPAEPSTDPPSQPPPNQTDPGRRDDEDGGGGSGGGDDDDEDDDTDDGGESDD
jgi:hypothetical protein